MLYLARVQKLSIEAMAHIACEIVWLKNLLIELYVRQPGPIHIHYDNQSVYLYCPESCIP